MHGTMPCPAPDSLGRVPETPPEPLWASSLKDQPRHDDVTVHVVREEPEAATPRLRRPAEPERKAPSGDAPFALRGIVLGTLAAVVVIALVTLLADRGSLTVKDVPSSWGDVSMTCKTTRLEQDGHAFELFNCHADRGGTLPPGVYRSPESQWTSDLTRRDARANAIRITPDGQLYGWAVY
jgi:hypothetical protein